MKKHLIVFMFILTFLLLPLYAHALQCEVTKVLDGDTIHCKPVGKLCVSSTIKMHKDGTITVRLRGIDAPEKRQPFGEEARLSLKELVGNKTVELTIKDVDRYGRAVAYVMLNNVNVNLEQIKRGYAWAYKEYLDRPYVSEFYEAEKQARKQKLGLWQESNPTPPWEWRKKNK